MQKIDAQPLRYGRSGTTPTGAGQTPPPNSAGARHLEERYWKAIELVGNPTPTQEPNREAHLLFQVGGRVSGSDGCNRITGSYELKGDSVTFGQMAGTQMECTTTGEIERAFREALKRGDLEVEQLESAGVRSTGSDARQVPAQLPSRSNCETVGRH